MPSFVVAEWILSLVMPRERAAAVVGDLVESSSGPVSLWLSVVVTFLESLVRQFFEPVEMAMAAKDFVGTAAVLSVRYTRHLLLPVLILYVGILIWPQLTPAASIVVVLLGTLLSLAITLVVPWKTGRIVAERHPGKELPAFVAICAAGVALSAISSALGTPWNSILSEEPWVLLRWNQIPTPWNPVLMLISMILIRRRALHKADTAA
jgi:hypothetical protein